MCIRDSNWAYDAHPEWRMLDSRGLGSREAGADHGFMTGSRYGLVCPNNEQYRAFVKAQFAECCREYDFEGVFLDMTSALLSSCAVLHYLSYHLRRATYHLRGISLRAT